MAQDTFEDGDLEQFANPQFPEDFPLVLPSDLLTEDVKLWSDLIDKPTFKWLFNQKSTDSMRRILDAAASTI